MSQNGRQEFVESIGIVTAVAAIVSPDKDLNVLITSCYGGQLIYDAEKAQLQKTNIYSITGREATTIWPSYRSLCANYNHVFMINPALQYFILQCLSYDRTVPLNITIYRNNEVVSRTAQ